MAYNARVIIEARLQRLMAGGQILERDGRHVTKRSPMLYIAKALRASGWSFTEPGPPSGRSLSRG